MHPTFVSPEMRSQDAAHIAITAGWKAHPIATPMFTLMAYGPAAQSNAKTLTIYIEGDGLAWLADDLPSENPTPIMATALQMAIHDQKNSPIAYLARPCQFVSSEHWGKCQAAYWTNLRFSPEVIHAMNQAVDNLKHYYHVKHIQLVGYSGGGTIAALIAAERKDVIRLITVAAVLDVEHWVHLKRLTPLSGSLNPADVWEKLATIPQTHWVGGKDRVVPQGVAFAYARHFPKHKKPNIIVVPAFDHVCCWGKDWV